jgi:hypothetical protein
MAADHEERTLQTDQIPRCEEPNQNSSNVRSDGPRSKEKLTSRCPTFKYPAEGDDLLK